MRNFASAASACAMALLLLSGCQPEGEGPPDQEEPVQLVEGQRSRAAFPDARVEITAPEAGATVTDTPPAVRIDVSGFELGASTPGAEERGLAMSDDGQHLHVIVDNEPYTAVYDASEPVDVGPLDPGVHVVRAFASRQWHESVKSPGAYDATHFVVGEAAAETEFDPDAPYLTYSRPKGTYAGAGADSVMVDFYLRNAELGPDAHTVRLTVDGSVVDTVDSWVPHFLVGLEAGDHTVELELLGPDGGVVPGPFNATERVITVERPPEQAG